MPLIKKSLYPGPPRYQFNGHLQTIIPAIFGLETKPDFKRERITLPDGDFLDLDWLSNNNERVAILTHGLEGNTDRAYIRSMTNLLQKNNWDVLAWNCRSCSGEMNRNFRLYYHGDTYDIDQVVRHALGKKRYQQVSLFGFSMGGAIQMKYLGTKGEEVPKEISHAVSVSAPCDIKKGVEVLERRENTLYRKRFFRTLQVKAREKALLFPERLDLSKMDQIKNWADFDTYFSAPINGFESIEDFYQSASAKNFIDGIRVPTLLLNALNDPILSENCYPEALAKHHSFLHLETPKKGGHIGFTDRRTGKSWSNLRALQFIDEI